MSPYSPLLRTAPSLIPAAVACIGLTFSAAAGASGFQLLEQNASGIGNAYAGSAVVAENASTVFFNPAGMTQLKAREFSVGVAAIRPSVKFTDKGSSSGFLRGEGGDGGGLAFVPNAYATWALTPDVYVGVGIGAPYGLVTRYKDTWIGAAQAARFGIKTFNINPSIAFRVNERWSIGAGVSWQRMEVEYVRRAAASPLAPLARLDVHDDAWGWNVGALYTLSPDTRLGMSYRSDVKHALQGPLNVSGVASFSTRAEVTLPDTLILSASHQLSPNWELLGDISGTAWSSIARLDVVSGSATLQTLHTHFKDTWRVAFGANYRFDDAWKLKLGVAYDQTPVRDANRRLVSLPDNDRTWLSVGTQWKPGNGATLDVGVAYLLVGNANINSGPTAGTVVRGTYDDSLWILGAQYSVAY